MRRDMVVGEAVSPQIAPRNDLAQGAGVSGPIDEKEQFRATPAPSTTPHPEKAPFPDDGRGRWENEADRICAAMVKRAPDVLRKASEALYEQMLYDVQDYLRDNVEFNLSSELASAKHRADAAEARARRLDALIESHDGALRLLRRAISEGDPKEELLLRVTDMLKELSPAALSKATGGQHRHG